MPDLLDPAPPLNSPDSATRADPFLSLNDTASDTSSRVSSTPSISSSPPSSPSLSPLTDIDFDLDLDDLSSFDLVGSDWIRVLRDNLRSQREELSTRLGQTPVGRKFRSLAEAQRAAVHKQLKALQKPEAVKTRDKVSFVFGVTNIWLSALMDAVPWLYTMKIAVLLTTRLIVYRRKRWHYFMFDMCYYVNALLILFLFSPATHPNLFRATWGLANGPVLAAITAWRNSLVFHSLDKVTSLLIHFDPPLTLFVLRWCAGGKGGAGIATEKLQLIASEPALGFWDIMGPSVAAYLFWQAAYWVFVWSMKADKIKAGYATSTTYLLGDHKSLVYRLTRRFGPALQPTMFMALQLVFTLITVSATFLFHRYLWAHAFALMFSISMATYNGANYYIEVFSRRYMEELKGLEKQLEKMASGTAVAQDDVLCAAANGSIQTDGAASAIATAVEGTANGRVEEKKTA
ncbi:hypothetical protein HK104_003107 [Borealophlyctis nickersoniae]|nr:hypothetical protein HK104_003107 [Borealophlyctis nickersoniae]